MANTPLYAAGVLRSTAVVSTANTNRNGSGTIETVLTAINNGARIEKIYMKGTGTTTAGMLRLYVYDGTNHRLITEVAVTAITPSASTKAFEATLAEGVDTSIMPIHLKTGESLSCSTHNAETFHVTAIGGYF